MALGPAPFEGSERSLTHDNGSCNANVCVRYAATGAPRKLRESATVNGRKDEQIVVRVPPDLMTAIRDHQRTMQAARPFERVTVASAVRDLLATGLTAAKRRKR